MRVASVGGFGNQGLNDMQEFSKTIRFDFPRIPIIGTLLLLIVLLNVEGGLHWFLNEKGDVEIARLTACVIGLGVAGITAIQLVSMMMFNPLYPIKARLVSKQDGFTTSYEWFRYLKEQAVRVPRRRPTDGGDRLDDRRDIKVLTNQQIHATLHALEMECRAGNPSFGIQLEYYYSLYLFFLSSALAFLTLIVIQLVDRVTSTGLDFYGYSVWLDLVLFIAALLGTIQARRMKEYLRITLFNHNRKKVLELIGGWYQCTFDSR